MARAKIALLATFPTDAASKMEQRFESSRLLSTKLSVRDSYDSLSDDAYTSRETTSSRWSSSTTPQRIKTATTAVKLMFS